MASQQQQQQVLQTIPLKVIVDKQNNKVVFVEANKDFVETLFSFLSLPLATIFRLLATAATTTNNNNNDQQQQLPESSPFLANIKNLCQTVYNRNSNILWNNPFCQHMLLNPRNPCESMCMKLFLNIDDTQPSTKFYVCGFCDKFTTLRYLRFSSSKCTCGKPPNIQPQNLDSEVQGNYAQNGVFVRETTPWFLVSDDLKKIVPSSAMNSLEMLIELGYSDLTQLEEVTHNISKQEILNLLKYTLTSHEPLTNTILKSSSKIKGNSSPTQSASPVRLMPCISDKSKMDIKVLQSKSQKNIIGAEANGDFVDFIFSFLTMPLGSIVKLLGANSFAGCVGNLYKSVENLDPSSVLLNPGIAPQFGCANQPLNIPHVLPPPTAYYYGLKRKRDHYDFNTEMWVISKSNVSLVNPRVLISLDPRPLNMSREGVVGFVNRAAFYAVCDDLKVKQVFGHFRFNLSLMKKQNLTSLEDLEVKVISIGEAEALRFLGALLTSKFTLNSVLGDFLNVPTQESTSASN